MIRNLFLLALVSCIPLQAKEIFDLPCYCTTGDFDFASVKTVSFFCPGNKEIDIASIIKPLVKRRADLVVTGKTSIIGESLSPDVAVYITLMRNGEKAAMVTVNAYVYGVATKAISTSGEKYRGNIPIAGDTLVFSPGTELNEIEQAISTHLQSLIDKILSSSKARPKFFVVSSS